MFREMRKKSREISRDESIELLKNTNHGVLSTIGENGYPYGITLNHVYANNAIYFHCAKKGQKIDNILYNNKVSFCVAGEYTIRPEKFDTLYIRVVVFGKTSLIDGDEKRDAPIEIIKNILLIL
ncbi:MAG: pyridoxamine 5'-phosphate oxidase family protein [Romboutsia sp.]